MMLAPTVGLLREFTVVSRIWHWMGKKGELIQITLGDSSTSLNHSSI
jgi:hypothetical protein